MSDKPTAEQCAEQIVRQLEVDDPMGPDGRRYTVQWIAAIIAEAKDSEFAALRSELEREKQRAADPAPSVTSPDYKSLTELAARVILQHMNDEDYEMSLAGLYATLTEHTLAAPAENSVSPATPELCSFCGLPRDEHAREAMDYTKLSVNPNNVTWKWNVEACPMGEQPFHSTSVFTAAAPASVSQDICPHKLPFYRCDVCEETARIPTVTKSELEDIN